MEVILAKYAGFCPGVKKAWKLVEKAIREETKPVYILGELIHNQQALDYLTEKGVKTIDNPEDVKERKGTLFIRAHGEPPSTYKKLRRLKVKTVDATCLNVIHVQELALQLDREGYLVIVCGEKDHPEALATVGYTKDGQIISSVKEALEIGKGKKIGVISQTTFSADLFKQITDVLQKNASEFRSLGTICNFTQMAQKEAREIASKVDIVIVVGGKHSSNTKRLAEVASQFKPTHHIETALELQEDWFRGVKKVALLAGASTPGWIIQETARVLEKQ